MYSVHYEKSREHTVPLLGKFAGRDKHGLGPVSYTHLDVYKRQQLRAVQCICQEYRFALQDACRIALAETVAARLARLLIELSHQIGEHTEAGEYRFPLLLTHEEMASMTCTTRETVTRTLGQFRKDGWISIEDSILTLHSPDRLQSLL